MDTSRQTQAADTGLVYGKNAVAEILKSGRAADVVYIQEGMPEKQAAYYSALAREAGAVTKRIHAAKLAAMCGTQSHQGVAARAAQIEYVTLDALLDAAREKGSRRSSFCATVWRTRTTSARSCARHCCAARTAR